MNTSQWVLSRDYNVHSIGRGARVAGSFGGVSTRVDRRAGYLYLVDRARPPTQQVPT